MRHRWTTDQDVWIATNEVYSMEATDLQNRFFALFGSFLSARRIRNRKDFLDDRRIELVEREARKIERMKQKARKRPESAVPSEKESNDKPIRLNRNVLRKAASFVLSNNIPTQTLVRKNVIGFVGIKNGGFTPWCERIGLDNKRFYARGQSNDMKLRTLIRIVETTGLTLDEIVFGAYGIKAAAEEIEKCKKE